jgi:hypothetical protein
MSVEALFSLDQAVSRIRGYQADVAEQPPCDLDALTYLLRHEHRVPHALDSIARTLGNQVMRHDHPDERFFRFSADVVVFGSMRSRRMSLVTPENPDTRGARLEINLASPRQLPWSKKLPRESLLLGVYPDADERSDLVKVGDDSHHPHLPGNHGVHSIGVFHGFALGVSRLSGAAADAAEKHSS